MIGTVTSSILKETAYITKYRAQDQAVCKNCSWKLNTGGLIASWHSLHYHFLPSGIHTIHGPPLSLADLGDHFSTGSFLIIHPFSHSCNDAPSPQRIKSVLQVIFFLPILASASPCLWPLRNPVNLYPPVLNWAEFLLMNAELGMEFINILSLHKGARDRE